MSVNDAPIILASRFQIPSILSRGGTVEMPQGIDDFAIVLPQLTAMGACELKVYSGLDRL